MIRKKFNNKEIFNDKKLNDKDCFNDIKSQ